MALRDPSQARPEDFFHGVALELWRRAVPPAVTAVETAFLLSKLALPKGAHVLDVPCGFGRHAVALAEAGLEVTAIDFAEEYTSELATLVAERRLAVRVLHRDMRSLDGLGSFDAVLCLGNSFGYLEDDQQRRFVGAVGQVVAPGGQLFIDTSMAAEALLPNLKERFSFEAGDITMHVENDYDVATSRLWTKYRFVRRGAWPEPVTERTLSHGVYTVAELGRMVESAGLRVTGHFVGTSEVPFTVGAPRLLLTAEKSRTGRFGAP